VDSFKNFLSITSVLRRFRGGMRFFGANFALATLWPRFLLFMRRLQKQRRFVRRRMKSVNLSLNSFKADVNAFQVNRRAWSRSRRRKILPHFRLFSAYAGPSAKPRLKVPVCACSRMKTSGAQKPSWNKTYLTATAVLRFWAEV
jgi:hypothetical protein